MEDVLNRKQWVIAGAVVAAVLLVGGLWALVLSGSPEPAQLRTSSSGTTGTASTTTSGSAAGAQGADGSGSTSGTAGTGQSGAANSNSGSSAKNGKKQSTPVEPQTQPVPLTELSHLPTGTVAFLDAAKVSPGSTYDVTFVPFGFGSVRHFLAITLTASTPKGNVTHPFDFTGQNVLVESKIPAKSAVTKGGTYTGTLVLVSQGDVLLPVLTQASASR
jgi:hypothetical protein